MPDTAQPTEKELAEHMVSHTPYRGWCRACVAGRGKADPHRRHADEESAIPIVSCDYCFMGEANEAEAATRNIIPIMVHRNHKDRWITSHPVRRKGRDPWLIGRVTEDFEQAGYAAFVYKSDGEPAIKDFKAGVSAAL